MKRALYVWFPLFTIDLLRKRHRRGMRRSARDRAPILVAERVGQRRIVIRCCERAAAAGVCAGLPVSEALALIPGGQTLVEEHAPERESAALRAVAIWARRFSPMVAVDPPDGLLVDVTGSARVFGGETQLAERIAGDAQRIRLQSRVAVASTFACARAVARWGIIENGARTAVIADRAERAALAPLPVRALGIEDAAVDGLSEVGVDWIGQLMELPRSALPARFGVEALRRLDEALGQAIEAIEPVRLVAPPEVERIFDGPTTQWEAIELTTRALLDALCDEMLARESGARLIEVELERSETAPERLSLPLSAPSREPRHLWGLIRPRLERMNMGDGVERITLRAPRLARLRHEQLRQWGADAARNTLRHMGELIDTLINRFGADRVLVMDPADSHIPERAFRARSAIAAPPPTLAHAQADTTPSVGDRPLTLYERPKEAPVIALTPDGPILSARFDGIERRIISCIGPERIGGEWWRDADAERDYFKVQDESGRWWWLCREYGVGNARGGWFVHGAW